MGEEQDYVDRDRKKGRGRDHCQRWGNGDEGGSDNSAARVHRPADSRPALSFTPGSSPLANSTPNVGRMQPETWQARALGGLLPVPFYARTARHVIEVTDVSGDAVASRVEFVAEL